jgi:hypothetical protein
MSGDLKRLRLVASSMSLCRCKLSQLWFSFPDLGWKCHLRFRTWFQLLQRLLRSLRMRLHTLVTLRLLMLRSPLCSEFVPILRLRSLGTMLGTSIGRTSSTYRPLESSLSRSAGRPEGQARVLRQLDAEGTALCLHQLVEGQSCEGCCLRQPSLGTPHHADPHCVSTGVSSAGTPMAPRTQQDAVWAPSESSMEKFEM